MEKWRGVGALDRADQLRRDPDWVARQWARWDAQLLRVDSEDRIAADADGTAPRGVRVEGTFDPDRHFLLGLAAGVPWFTTNAEPDGATASLRRIGAVAEGLALELTVGATALTAWHRLEPHCSACGARTAVESGGTNRRCPACGRVHFPRQDPAVIVAVLDPDDRILLGRQPTWAPGRMSVLAGFVEAGESLEQAVHREIHEESGVRLTDVHYFGSQPWPFPRSLMVGFTANAENESLAVARDEIEDAAWFTRAEVDDAVLAGRLTLPGEASIAHRLIKAWATQELSAHQRPA